MPDSLINKEEAERISARAKQPVEKTVFIPPGATVMVDPTLQRNRPQPPAGISALAQEEEGMPAPAGGEPHRAIPGPYSFVATPEEAAAQQRTRAQVQEEEKKDQGTQASGQAAASPGTTTKNPVEGYDGKAQLYLDVVDASGFQVGDKVKVGSAGTFSVVSQSYNSLTLQPDQLTGSAPYAISVGSAVSKA